MKQIFGLFALLLGVCAANAQETDTVKYAAGNDLYRGITRKLPYRQMVTPYGVEVTFAKTVHIIFPAAVLIKFFSSPGYGNLDINFIIFRNRRISLFASFSLSR